MQTALFLPLLAEHYDTACSVFYGLEGSPIRWNDIPLLPGLGGDFGSNTLLKHAEHYFGGDRRGGITMILADVWPFNAQEMRELNLACWCPVDHEPAPPGVLRFLADSLAIPIAMSRFGEQQLSVFNPLYVPHGVDTSVFRPGQGAKARANSFPEGSFVVAMVAANKGRPSRKGFCQAMQAFGRFAKEHDNVFLYLHSILDPNHGGGENLLELAAACEIPDDRFRVADQYALVYKPYTADVMAQIYGSIDVLLNPSFGEGFGIPVLEAQACGKPVIVNDFTAMREVAGAGWHVKHQPFWTGLGSWQATPDVNDIVSALEECYAMSPQQREKLGKAARRHAMKYDVRRVFKQDWLPAMREIERRFADRTKTAATVVLPAERQWTVSVVTPWREHPEFRADFDMAMACGKPDEVLIIDDGSAIPVEGAAFRFDKPAGFVQAVNKGLEFASGDVVVVLNNDIRPLASNWLDIMLAAIEPGAIVGELRNEWHAWVDNQPVPYIDGWCFAIMREDFERLGGFDPSYQEPAYFADNDLCVRAVAAGMRLVAVQVGLEHIRGGTTGEDVRGRQDVTVLNQRLYMDRVRDLKRVAEMQAA